MNTCQLIRTFIDQLPIDTLFTTRDLLNFGNRSVIDNFMSLLVRSGELVRVARGMFHRKERKTPVTPLEAATTKALSFGRKLFQHADDIAQKLGVSRSVGGTNHRFHTNGRSSSFKLLTTGQRIFLEGTSQKKSILAQTKAGNSVRALCALGKGNVSKDKILTATQGLSKSEKEEVTRLCASMPWWLSNQISIWFRASIQSSNIYRQQDTDGEARVMESGSKVWKHWSIESSPLVVTSAFC